MYSEGRDKNGNNAEQRLHLDIKGENVQRIPRLDSAAAAADSDSETEGFFLRADFVPRAKWTIGKCYCCVFAAV